MYRERDVYIYIYVYMFISMYIYIYIYISGTGQSGPIKLPQIGLTGNESDDEPRTPRPTLLLITHDGLYTMCCILHMT